MVCNKVPNCEKLDFNLFSYADSSLQKDTAPEKDGLGRTVKAEGRLQRLLQMKEKPTLEPPWTIYGREVITVWGDRGPSNNNKIKIYF